MSLVPNGWMRKNLGEVARVYSGGTPSRAQPAYWGDEIAWASTAEIDAPVIGSTKESITQAGLDNSSAKIAPAGTLLMAMYGQGKTRGKTSILGIPAAMNQACAAIEPTRDIDATYLLVYLRHNYDSIRSLSNSGGQENLSGEIVKKIPVVFPEIREQLRIAKVSQDAEDLIDTLEMLIAKEQAIKRGMMQQLLSGRTRLPGFSEPWRTVRLDSGLSFQVGFPFRSAWFSDSAVGTRLVRNRDLKSDDSIIYFTGHYHPAFLVRDGDVLVGMDGDFTPCVWCGGKSLLNQRVGRLICTRFDSLFMYYALQGPLKALEGGTGATTVKHLSHKDVEALELVLPELDEQKAIAGALKSVDDGLDALTSRAAKAKLMKQGVMQELLTGGTRLPLAEAVA
jgi:type I restriction enzyme S subunit